MKCLSKELVLAKKTKRERERGELELPKADCSLTELIKKCEAS